MVRNSKLVAFVLLVVLSAGCRRYTFTMHHQSGEGKESFEEQVIYAPNDSAAYSKAMTIYYLALRAGNRMNENARPFIFKPVDFSLIDGEGRDLDSVLGVDVTERIRESKSSGGR